MSEADEAKVDLVVGVFLGVAGAGADEALRTPEGSMMPAAPMADAFRKSLRSII